MTTTTRDASTASVRAGLGTLAIVVLGYLTLPMSMSGASVAVPRVAAELAAPGAPAQWVVTGYFLAASSFMLVAGSLGDVLGRRRVYRTGATLYAAGTLAAACSPTIEILLAARVLTGLGAAGVLAGGAAILANTFDGPARTRTFAAMGTAAGIGLAVGPTLSGWIVGTVGWRASFGIYALAGIVLVVGARSIRESRVARSRPIDWTGTATSIAGSALLMFALSQGADLGWSHPLSLATLIAGGILIVAFVLVERRTPWPMLDLSLLSNRPFTGWLLASVAVAFGFGGVLAYLPTYLQTAGGLAPAATGWVLLIPTLPMLIMPLAGGRLVNRGVPPAVLVTVALLLISAGNAWLTVLQPELDVRMLAGPLVAIGVGVGLAAGITDAQAMNQVGAGFVGMASGVLNTVRGGANALILALFGSALLSLLTNSLGSSGLAGQAATGTWSENSAEAMAGHLTDAWRTVLVGIAVLLLATAPIVYRLVRRPAPHADSAEGTATPEDELAP